ncbi:MAG: DUF1289 domain-containing protein [Kaistia sp. SCN 65-12]|nr:MAG: DUF1289 domain-containing protein [Kaistia sp. SCN 65-12]
MITPCISICVIDPESELCEGCGRTLDEISNWSRMTAEERRAVMAELAGRRENRGVPA